MIRVAAFSDVHSNFQALRNVWTAIESLEPQVNVICNAGDTMAYGSEPEQCVRFIREHEGTYSVAGNYDQHVADFPSRREHYREKWMRKRPAKYEAIQRDSASISEQSRDWLRELPAQQTIVAGAVRISLSHYSPYGRKDGLTPVTPVDRLMEIGDAVKCDVVVVGHTHMPFVRRVGSTLFVNPGSVGRAFGDPSWALIQICENGQINAEIHRWRE